MAASVRDIFICHASEDKPEIVRPIVHALEEAHISFWYDESEINWGDSIVQKVNEGISKSQYVMVVLSKNFFSKNWPQRELNAVLNIEATSGEVRILPLLVGSDNEKKVFLEKFPLLNDKMYLLWNNNPQDVVNALSARLSGNISQSFNSLPHLELAASPQKQTPLPPIPHFETPYHLLQGFLGRKAELKFISEWYVKRLPILFINGVGGIGKSALIWHWMQNNFIDDSIDETSRQDQKINLLDRPSGIFWWSFYDPKNTVDKFFEKLFYYISLGTARHKHEHSETSFLTALFSILQDKKYLIVLDGFEKLLSSYSNAYPSAVTMDTVGNRMLLSHIMDSFLVQSAARNLASKIIITTRLLPTCIETIDDELINGVCKIELQDLQEEIAIEFFEARGISGTLEEFRSVFRLLGRHPLTLRLIAGFVRKQLLGTNEIKTFLQSQEDLVIKDKGRHSDVVEIAYKQLSQKQAELLGRIAAFYGPIEIEEISLFSPFESDRSLEKAISDLLDRGLLQYNREKRLFDLHSIIRQFAYKKLSNKKEVHYQYSNYFSDSTKSSSSDLKSELDNVIAFYYHLVMAERKDKAVNLFFDRLWNDLFFRFQSFELCFDLIVQIIDLTEYKLSFEADLGTQVRIYEAAMLLCDKLGELTLCANFATKAAEVSEQLGPIGFDLKFNPDSRICFQLCFAGNSYRCLGKLEEANKAFTKAIEYGKKARQYFSGRLDNPMSMLLGGEYDDIGMEEIAIARAHTEFALLKAQTRDIEGAVELLLTAQQQLKYSVSKSNYKEESIVMWRVNATKIALAAGDLDFAQEWFQLNRKEFDILGQFELDTSGGYSVTSHIRAYEDTVLGAIKCEKCINDPSPQSFEECKRILLQALEGARKHQLSIVEAEALIIMGKSLYAVKRAKEARQEFEKAKRLTIRQKYELLLLEAEIYLCMIKSHDGYTNVKEEATEIKKRATSIGMTYTHPSVSSIADYLIGKNKT